MTFLTIAVVFATIGFFAGFFIAADSSEKARPGLTCEDAQELIDERRTP